jgi:ribose transport system substrate-binding protein
LRYPRRLRAVAFGLVGLAAAVAVAACGSSNKSSTTAATTGGASTGGASTAAASDPTAAGVAYAKQQIAASTAVPTFKLKAPAFDMSKIKGKVIFNIPVTSAVPYVISVDKAAAGVVQKYGAKWVEYTNQGTPNEWTAGINQAIAQHANAIILGQGMAIQLVIPALKKAAAAHIPVIVTHDFQNGQMNTPPPTGPGKNVLP